ncbi:hypothetical protein [Mesorhizobium sp. M1169]|uniref:hypothetical protein n=1 Tax=Mesorhizobium sp. M1169 TaxID=2957066 RepID=UPI00333C88A0
MSNDAIQRKDRVRSDNTRRRLRAMIEIINKVEPRFVVSLCSRCKDFRLDGDALVRSGPATTSLTVSMPSIPACII